MQQIEIATERLIIRTPNEKDTQDVFALMNDKETALSTGFRAMSSPSEAEGKIRRGMTSQNMFVIVKKEMPAHVIGVFEVMPNKTDTVIGEKWDYHICYFLNRESRQKGYMTEVLAKMKAYLFNERMADLLTITVFPRNNASRRVAMKSGFVFKRLEKECVMTGEGELTDLEFYTLAKENFEAPKKQNHEETIRLAERQKWINEGGILYPIPGYATLLANPGNGIFRIHEEPRSKRLGLERIDESFVFDFKIYDLDCEDVIEHVIRTWTSELFIKSNKNLGIIFNGLKGTGKTIAAKLLSNRIGLPVIVISKPLEGMLEFIQSLCFESVILIDEAEKTFNEEREVLLKMIDGVYNSKRKLYILTTNRLSIDENLLGRPGRIRYIKEFGNLSAKAVNDVIDDNLMDVSLKDDILKLVDTLEISTIDILKSIVEECNITGKVPASPMLNIPKAKYKIRVVTFEDLDTQYHQEVKSLIKEKLGIGETTEDWLMKIVDYDDDKKAKRNKDVIEEKYHCDIDISSYPSTSVVLYSGQLFRHGIIVDTPDSAGFFTLEYDWHDPDLCCLGNGIAQPSLYRGQLLH